MTSRQQIRDVSSSAIRTIVVIGSNSFSGSDFIDLLLEDPRNAVIGISRSVEKCVTFLPYRRHERSKFSFHQLDLNTDCDRIIRLLDLVKPDYIVNFAAQSEVAPSWIHPEHWFQTNVVALAKLTNALKDRDYLKRYVHISSPEVYGSCEGRVSPFAPLNPSTPYAASKAAADLYLFTLVKNYNFPLVMVRATNVYGAYQQLFKIIPRTIISLKLGKTIQLHGGGNAIKSYIHIRDVSRGELLAMEYGQCGQIYHFSPERGIAVRDVVQRLCHIFSKDFSDVTIAVEERLGQDAAYEIDSSASQSTLGWSTNISFEEGLQQTVDWIEQNWQVISKSSLEYQHAA